jgi:hypothetical protein
MFKKALAITVLTGVAVTSAYAGPMGPVKPSMGRFGLEFEVSADDRDMEWTGNAADKSHAENINYLGRLSYGLTENVEIYGRLGGASFDIVDDVDVNATEQTFEGSGEFAWGGGIAGILYDAGTWNIAGNANYLAHSSHTGTITPAGTTNNDIDFSEWNLGLQIQGKYDQFLPYLGVKYSDATIEYNRLGGAAVADEESDNNVGVYVGAGIDLAPQWSAYIEGRFVDETSFGGGIRYTF